MEFPYLGPVVERVKNWLADSIEDWENKTYLLGVSGGVDSSVLVENFYRLKLKFEIAHCNFQLRGKESDEDEEFVKTMAEKCRAPFHSVHFETKNIVSQSKHSVQMVARDLRFTWFEKTRQERNLDFVVLGSQKDDQVETMLINLVRGTGLAGLHGIRGINNRVLRPLLNVTREEIRTFSNENDVVFREDSSNASTNYMRNRLRHDVIPVMKELNENISRTMEANAKRLQEAEEIFYKEINRQRALAIAVDEGRISFNKNLLLNLSPLSTYLFEFLRPYGFSETVVNEIVNSLHQISGKQFLSPSHRAIMDREYLFIEEREHAAPNEKVDIGISTASIQTPINLTFETLEKQPDNLKLEPCKVLMDLEKVSFPLELRKWELGDKMRPFGMKKSKKVSDILIDAKVPLHEKDRTYVLVSGNEIIWLIGQRVSESVKVLPKTKKVLFVQWKK